MSTAIANHDSWPERHAALERLLRAHQELLREQRRALREAPPQQTTVGADDEERAAQEPEVELDIALLEMHSRQVREIEMALQLLEAGAYGRCVDCDEPIQASRLQARPFAIRCRSCQKELEGDADERRRTAAVATSGPGWALLGSIPGPAGWRAPTTPKMRRRHRATAVPVTRPLSFGGVSLRGGGSHESATLAAAEVLSAGRTRGRGLRSSARPRVAP
jgi:RNA polymerase-binding protein DksA